MTFSVVFVLSLLSAARAANDWNKPCLSGFCSYDLPSANGSTSSGSMKIWGSTTAIGDITEAAGWEILGCSPDVLTQDIRLVCTGATSMCQHLYQGHGAVDTIVRLPDDCGKGPFARVQRSWVPADQTIPASVAARIVRRDGSQPQVQAITLDTNFAAANNTKTGATNLAIYGVNVPGFNDILSGNGQASRRRSRLNQRQNQSFVADAANSISNAISSANTVNINKSKTLPAADFSKTVSLFEQSLDCPPITAEASVNVDATAHAVVTVGVAASGTIVPPKITDFSLLASLTADLTGQLQLKAELSGTLDSGNIQLFQAGIPGLDFPGILSIGPTFQVNARGTATAELAADLALGINYHVKNAQMSFPSGTQSGGSFSLGDTPLKLSADTTVEATTTVEAHLIPSINFGLSALDVATANIALSLDASATMVLKVGGKAGASATIQQENSKREDDADEEDADFTDDSADNFDSPDDSGNQGSDDFSDADFSGDDQGTDSADFSGDDEDTETADDPSLDDGSDDFSEGDQDTDSADDTGFDVGSNDVSDSSLDTGSDDFSGDDQDTDSTDDTSLDIGSAPTDGSLDSDSDDATDNASLDSDPDNSIDDSGLDSVSDDSADATGVDDGSDDTTDDSALDSGLDDSTDDIASDDATDSDDNGLDTTNNSTSIGGTGEDGDDNGLDSSSSNSTSTDTGDENQSGQDFGGSTDSTSTETGDSTDQIGLDSDSSSNSTSTDTGDDEGFDSADNSTSIGTGEDESATSTATTTSDSSATATSSSAPLASITTAADASFGGSFVISGGLDLSASATGTFFGLFDASKKFSLFKKSFQLLSKRFGDEGDDAATDSDTDSDTDSRRALLTRPFRTRRILRARRFALYNRGLTCLAGSGESKDLADETISGKSL